jgi:hypothetical protein
LGSYREDHDGQHWRNDHRSEYLGGRKVGPAKNYRNQNDDDETKDHTE